jgi:hypothetical protein
VSFECTSNQGIVGGANLLYGLNLFLGIYSLLRGIFFQNIKQNLQEAVFCNVFKGKERFIGEEGQMCISDHGIKSSMSLIYCNIPHYSQIILLEAMFMIYNVYNFGLAQDRYRWRALVNSVMNLWVP